MPASQRPLLDRLVISLVKLYRNTLSHNMLPACRFSPSCSGYALEAVEKYGAIRGSLLVMRRVFRCNPMTPCGFDPVR